MNGGQWARPFRIVNPTESGLDQLVWHGVQFPDGTCVVRLFHGLRGATCFEELTELVDSAGAVVEWADGGQP